MKKIFTLAFALMSTFSVFAQDNDTFQFCTADGTIIIDGTEVYVDDLDADAADYMGEALIDAGIYVTNTSSDEATAELAFTIEEMPEGASLQCCLGSNCRYFSATGDYVITGETFAAGQTANCMLHASAELGNYFQVTGTFTIRYVDDMETLDCSTITIIFRYADPSGVTNVSSDARTVVKTFDALGREVATDMGSGLRIQRMADGTVRKVLVK